MKASIYNTFFFHENSFVGYNALQDKFIILVQELYELYNAAIIEKNIPRLKEIHNNFYNHLVENGFIISEEINELEEVKKIVRKNDLENEEFYQLTINPTMNCNFKCWYCYETHIKVSKMNSQTVDSVVNCVKAILLEKKDLKKFVLRWFGGEPLLYFDKTVLPILEQVYPLMRNKEINFTSGFTTNGLLINRKMLEECKNNGVNNFQITLDGHRERHNQVRYVSDTRGSYDEIIENIKLCAKEGFSVSVRLNISQETLNNENILFVLEDFKDVDVSLRSKIFFSFHEVWQNEKDLTVDIQDYVNHFRSEGFHTGFKGDMDFVRNSCYADKKNHATINYNGDLFKCTARDFETKNREGFLDENGNLVWNEKYDVRLNSKFKNKPCLDCRILPICNGGCSQQALEHIGIDYCVNDFDEIKKTNIVKDKFLYTINN